MTRFLLFGLIAAGTFLTSIGCSHCNPRPPDPYPCPQPQVFPQGSVPPPVGGPGFGPVPKGGFLPDTAPPPVPIGSQFQSKSIEPQPYGKDFTWQPGQGSGGPPVRIYPPAGEENPYAGKQGPLNPPEGFDGFKPPPPPYGGKQGPLNPPEGFDGFKPPPPPYGGKQGPLNPPEGFDGFKPPPPYGSQQGPLNPPEGFDATKPPPYGGKQGPLNPPEGFDGFKPPPSKSEPPEYGKDWPRKPGPGTEGPSVRLYPPEVDENPDAAKKGPLNPKEGIDALKPPPPKIEESIKPMEPAALLPVGIPQFARVRDNVANGLRPTLDDGLGWLQANGYKTVLCLREPGVQDIADRKQVEKRGMKFLSLEISPMTLTQKKIDEFNRIVGDSAVLPLFVYDRDGSLTGSMWYLNFRTEQQATDEAARNQARPLGLREEREGAHKEMWQAAQKLF